MKQLTISVDESKYEFIIELLNNFHFVQVNEVSEEKKNTINHIAEGMEYAILASEGILRTKKAKAFINEF